jgi:F0F1-type ATP synthase assembly protein I
MDGRDLRDRQETWTGFGDTLARAIELVATPLLFGLGGWALDRWLGTQPVFMVVLFLFALVGMGARMYYGYKVAMEAHDQAGVWSHRPVAARDEEPS